MKLTVGNKSVIVSAINSALWSIISFAIIYAYYVFYCHIVEKYSRTMSDVWASNYMATIGDQFAFIGGLIIAIICLAVLIYNVLYVLIGVHYYKKTKTNITSQEIIYTTYGFPFNNSVKSIIVDDISSIEVNQSSIQRLLGCGNIYIKGYSNSNYSKTDFSINIDGLDSVMIVKNDIDKVFQHNLKNCKSEGKK